MPRESSFIPTVSILLLLLALPAHAQQTGSFQPVLPAPATTRISSNTPANVLTADEWQRVDAAVKRALRWLSAQQQSDGSFRTIDNGQPGVTSLCMMAFISHGRVPKDREYGKQLERATDFVISCQKPNGLVTLVGPDGPEISRNLDPELGT